MATCERKRAAKLKESAMLSPIAKKPKTTPPGVNLLAPARSSPLPLLFPLRSRPRIARACTPVDPRPCRCFLKRVRPLARHGRVTNIIIRCMFCLTSCDGRAGSKLEKKTACPNAASRRKASVNSPQEAEVADEEVCAGNDTGANHNK